MTTTIAAITSIDIVVLEQQYSQRSRRSVLYSSIIDGLKPELNWTGVERKSARIQYVKLCVVSPVKILGSPERRRSLCSCGHSGAPPTHSTGNDALLQSHHQLINTDRHRFEASTWYRRGEERRDGKAINRQPITCSQRHGAIFVLCPLFANGSKGRVPFLVPGPEFYCFKVNILWCKRKMIFKWNVGPHHQKGVWNYRLHRVKTARTFQFLTAKKN